MPVESETTLYNQEGGKSWEYQVIAVNKVGEPRPSNVPDFVV